MIRLKNKVYRLEDEVKRNLEQNHAIFADHTFEHEIALAASLGIFGSIDINRGDYITGWGYGPVGHERLGDAKIRRQSIDADDLLHAHVASMDANCPRCS